MTPAARHPLPLGPGILAAALGGALGALARWGLTQAFPTATGHLPWTTFAINVAGSALLAALGLLPVARRTPWVPVFLGTGVLGGFTTMSAASVETFALLDGGHPVTAAAYCLGTLAAALVAVWLIARADPAAEQAFEDSEGDR